MTANADPSVEPRSRHLARRAGGGALWATAVLGVLSVLGAIAATAFNVQPLVFRSGSMEPQISAGALALAQTMPAERAVAGDVVSVVDTDGRRVTHRVVSAMPSATVPDATELTLRGDANPAPDATPYRVEEVDLVLVDVPWLGHPVSWLSSPGAAFLLGIGATGLLVLVLRRPAGRRRAGAAAFSVAAAALVVPAAGPGAPIGTDAAFTDVADFEAGVLAAHRVRAFNLVGGDAACQNIGTVTDGYFGSVRIRWAARDQRYDTAWTSTTGLRGGLKVDTQTAPPGTEVSTTFTSARSAGGASDVLPAAGGGPISIEGWSRLRSAPSWVAADPRVVVVDRQASGTGGVRCAGVNVQPTLTITQPTGGGSTTAVQTAINQACGTNPSAAACGTTQASGGKTITAVQYELRRQSFFTGTQCWNPGTNSYGVNSCGFREATLTGTGPVSWRVPGTNAYGGLIFGASYTLTVRSTDSSGQTFARVLNFNVS